MAYNLASANTKLLRPGTKIRVLGSIWNHPKDRLRLECELEGLVWTAGDKPDLLVIGEQKTKRLKRDGSGYRVPDYTHLEHVPAVTTTALLAYLQEARIAREEGPKQLLDVFASQPTRIGF